MHAILVTLGTDGDIFPYIGVGVKLRARGHRVTLASTEPYRDLATEHGFAFRPLMSNAEADEFLAQPDLWHPYKGALLGARWAGRYLQRHFDVITELINDDEAVLIANPALMAARVVHEKLGTPIASLILQPWIVPSIYEPPILPGISLPRWAPSWAGHLYWRTVDATGDYLVGRDVNRFRAAVGLAPIRRIFRWWLSPTLVIGMFPEWYGPPQADWPAQIRLAGFPMFDGRADGGLPADLLEFCESGPPPIAFTLGTGMMHAAEFFRAAVEACRLLNRRGILLTKFPHILPAPLPSVRHCAYAPFQELFPRCAAVVHHGGIGTTAKALAAAAPQLVLPLAFDQPDNAPRVQRLGVGAFLGPRRRNAKHLAQALAKLITPETKARCRAIAARFDAPDALDLAAGWVEELALSARMRTVPAKSPA